MSAAEQLELGAIGTPKRRKSPQARAREEMCKCGCELVGHAGKKHAGPCSRCSCKRGRPMKKRPVEIPPHLAPPNGALVLVRETEKQKLERPIGWALVLEDELRFYLSQLQTKSPNDFQHPQHQTRAQAMAIDSAYQEKCKSWTMIAIADSGVASRGRPTAIELTRISQGTMDRHDNVRGALKYVVDGIAEALLGGNDNVLEGVVAIKYSQEKPGKKGVHGVRVVIKWCSS